MTPYQHAAMVFDCAIAAHRIASDAWRAARRAGLPPEDVTRAALRARARAAHAAVRAAYDALLAARAAS